LRLTTSDEVREMPMVCDDRGYFECSADEVDEGDRYIYVLDGVLERPDPASRFQPEGVHGPSMVIDPESFGWTDGRWKGGSLSDYVIYELHVGVFTGAGTFNGAITYLDYLKDLGVTAVELMPVGQFPGSRNWGYDGVYPYAPQNSYGGPFGLKSFIDAAHSKGLSVILDVVYNHLGPEGNYLNDFGYYFTDRYKTPWGPAINFDGPYGDEVRNYFVSNACYWVSEFHIDALRLDAIHGIFDFSARHVLLELGEQVHALAKRLDRKVYVIAESDLNDARVITRPRLGGYGLDAQWNDDFHHSLHALLTDERMGYYQDFGKTVQMAGAIREGFVYTGQYSTYRKCRHGSSSVARLPRQFVRFSQNHDQVGNRPRGDRPRDAGSMEKLKLAAAVVCLTPGIPLLFMGEEYGETAPFPYFVDHGDPSLNEAVKGGRAEEFRLLGWFCDMPDPSREAAFLSAKINLELRIRPGHKEILAFYKEVLRVRKALPALRRPVRKGLEVQVLDRDRVITVRGGLKGEAWLAMFNFAETASRVALPPASGKWSKVLDSLSARWGGAGEQAPPQIDGLYGDVTLGAHGAVLYRLVPAEVR
jgi:maltooligosyltrehalose trehalohydrolase